MAVSARELIGREEEAEALLRLLATRDRLPTAAVLVGDAGIGKTTLWLSARAEARSSGYRVLSSRPTEAEASYAFTGLADLIGDVVDDVLGVLPPVQRRALEAAVLIGDSDVQVGPRAVAAAFLSVVRALAREGPVLLAVDDLQWIDASSLLTLQYALPRLGADPVAALLAVRGDVPRWLRRGLPEERLLTVELEGLSRRALHEVFRTRLGVALPKPVFARIYETSSGNPFFALELGRAIERRGGSPRFDEPLPIPGDLKDLLEERIDRVSGPAREAAEVVALLVDPTVTLVEAALGVPHDSGLSDAIDAGVLVLDGEHLRFTHPLLASAVASRMSPSRRRSLHTRLAAIVPTDEERARHLALATHGPDREIAAALEAASWQAHLRGAPAAAAELADQSLRLTAAADAGAMQRRLLIAANRHFEAGDNDRSIELFGQARAAAAPGIERATVLVQLAFASRIANGPADAAGLYRDALAETEGDDRLEATIHLSLAELARFGEGVAWGLEHGEQAVRAALRVSDPVLQCRARAAWGLLRFNAGHGIPRDEMEQALALERTLPEWPLIDGPAWVLGHQLWWADELEPARALLTEFREALQARDDPEEALALWHLAFLEWRFGNWDLATRHLADALSMSAQAGRTAAWLAQESPPSAIAAHQGQTDLARAEAERELAEAEAAGIRVAESGQRWVLGFIELSLGDAAAAVGHLRLAYEARNAFVLEPGMRLELGDLLEALIAVGEFDEAEEILTRWEERARALDRAWALALLGRCRALLLAARGDLGNAVAMFAAALLEHERSSDPFQHARTLLALGRTQRRARQRGAARGTLDDAIARFEQLGAPLWAEQARSELGRIGGRKPSRGELTAGEERIAALVSLGKSNREVAATLFLTEHTVETVLSRVYRKLGVTSRTELAHRLMKQSEDAAAAKR